ncbi:RNA-directed DNA polymerase [Halobacillus halophilus]|uniref:RNA-directed DNA polymerase n=1 Tax=Halobacillus halophilus (strain ATCC 35676 / DSM 2266 / JCM 20832 / KCTC 3685 / LMG 17431 / NBRC 102448 / NCIMB 2269) TaxID=866895 RepID=I0JJN7_HALH3|nr:retron St85 family RNA-directed DNA polymerase [Halobacillus halophilus]ASF38510.1 RNA-directed DNA polymerase [Halobacillus halophilus]CCG44356.1 probable RNA-directed DNA polymerase [Halobacillus halophilus DSM 2266]
MSMLERISNDLNLKVSFIENVLKHPKKQYRIYYIRKRNGGQRKIYHPSPVLKTLQYWLVNNVFNEFNVSIYATGYIKGKSIKDNAEAHKDSNFILNMDIENFFESINKKHVNELVNANGEYSSLDIYHLNKICFYGDFLPVGSVCSPHISNCIMYKFDNEVVEKLPNNFRYTRYADDITVSSSSYINDNVQVILEELLEKYEFRVNHNKTRYMSKKQSQMITGLNVNDGKVTIGTDIKKQLKKDLYNNLTKGTGDSEVILGKLNFLKSIEPDYFNKLIIKYSKYANVLNKLKNDVKEQKNIPIEINKSIEHT